MSLTSVSSSVYQVPAQRTIPRVEFKRVSDLPPEEREKVMAEIAASNKRLAEIEERRQAAERQRIADEKGYESNSHNAPNVISLGRESALVMIDIISEMIQSGEAEKHTLFTGNGEKATSNYRQYVYWLQQHVKELDGAGQSTLAQA